MEARNAESPGEPRPPAGKRPWGSFFVLPGGALLALCFFLPAVRTCGTPTCPYEAPGVAPPYAWGLLIAIGAFLRIILRARTPKAVDAAQFIISTALALAGAVFYAIGVFEEFDEDTVPYIAAIAAWLPLAALLATALRRGRSWRLRAARSLWTVAAMCAAWFVFMGIDSESTMYGLWLSVAGAAVIAAGGVADEVAARKDGGS